MMVYAISKTDVVYLRAPETLPTLVATYLASAISLAWSAQAAAARQVKTNFFIKLLTK